MSNHHILKIRYICAAFLLIIVLINPVCQAGKDVQNLLAKLDAVALGERRSSRLTIGELEEAYQEYESWDPAYRKQLIEFSPLIQLLIDFVFNPMKRFHELIGDSAVEQDAYIRRLEKNYKRFRDSYFGKLAGGSLVHSPKTGPLVDSLFGIGSKPLTLKGLREAKMEYDSYQVRINEIPEHEDIYATLDELESYRNYMALPWVKILSKQVFPVLDSIKEEQLPTLQRFFVEQMKQEGFMLHEGKLVRVSTH